MGVVVEEERQSFENQGPDLFSCLVLVGLPGRLMFLSNKIAKPFAPKMLVEF